MKHYVFIKLQQNKITYASMRVNTQAPKLLKRGK